MTFSKDQSAGYLINHLARIFARRLSARIKPLGLTPGTFPALLELWEKDGLTQNNWSNVSTSNRRQWPIPWPAWNATA